MQLSRLYSNRSDIFEPIDLHYGDAADQLNVVFGEMRKPKDRKKDAHNLGKTTLLHLIDFMMLKGVSGDHFLAKHQDRFTEFTFYMEIALNSGDFATVRRSPANPTRIGLMLHAEPKQDFLEAPDDAWSHPDLPIEEAIRLLDAWLDLRILKPYDYRKAITYFLRSQGDWSDELQLQKFQMGRDLQWKPFVAHLFGFNQNPIQRKYELDDSIQKLKDRLGQQQAEVQYKEDELPALAAKISVLQQQVDEIEAQLDAFQFDAEERRIVHELVGTIEQEIAELNQMIYNLRYDIRQIDNSLEHKDRFDLREIETIFSEAKVYFAGQIKREYSDLIAFKKKVTQERNSALRSRRKKLSEQHEEAEAVKEVLDARRESHLRIIRNTDTFEKFKALQKDLAAQRAQLVYLTEQRKKLETVAETARLVREQERDRGRVVDEIKAMVSRPSPLFERFRKTFNDYCHRVLDHEGIFYFYVNSNNNLDYSIGLGLAGQKGIASSQSEGTSYRKLVCALFDLALLKVYEGAPFFHFAYHDGIFEALDDRRKISFLEVVREQITECKLQYVLTVISTDLPRSPTGKVINFPENEVVLRLHDDGAQGRLFKMAEF